MPPTGAEFTPNIDPVKPMSEYKLNITVKIINPHIICPGVTFPEPPKTPPLLSNQPILLPINLIINQKNASTAPPVNTQMIPASNIFLNAYNSPTNPSPDDIN